MFSLTSSSSRSHSDVCMQYYIFMECKGFSLKVDSYDNLFVTNQMANCLQEKRNFDGYSAGIILQKTVIFKCNAVWFQRSYCCITNKKEKRLFTIYTVLKGKHAADNLGHKKLCYSIPYWIFCYVYILQRTLMWSDPHAHILLKIYDSTSNEKLNSAKYTDTLQCAIKDI